MLSEIIHQTNRAATKSAAGSVFWGIIVVATLICFLSGPFGTLDALPNGFRLIYWALIVVSTGFLGLWAHALIRTQQWQEVSIIALISGLFGFCASGVVIVLSQSLLHPIQSFPGPLALFIYSFPSATLIFFIMVLLDRTNAEPAIGPVPDKLPVLISRLEKHPNARRILALCAQDHYVEIITEMGSELCLIRLNDAIAEAAPQAGLQIHRSHWVAKSAVASLDTKGASPCVRLTDGRVLKVSHSRLKELKAFLE